MSNISELIKENCPNGVEYKFLKSFCDIKTGKGITIKDCCKDGQYPIISGGVAPMGYYDKTNRTANTITISRVGANAGFVNFINVDFYLNDKCFSVIPKIDINNKYLYYFLKNIEKDIIGLQSEGGVPTINTEKVGRIKVAIPPLEVQKEIVKILDKFGELEAELEARRSQYEFWRGKLIKNTTATKYKLNEIASIYDGTHSTPEYKNEGIPFISVENINNIYGSNKYISQEAYDKYKIKPQLNDVFMTRIGSIGVCSVFEKEIDLAYYVSLALIRPNNIINSRYLKYYLESSIGQEELRKKTLVHAVPIKINKDDIGKIHVLVPSMEEQKRIVNILDRFDKLITDISVGLPAEIEARRKQYEYYRDKLLSFEEVEINE